MKIRRYLMTMALVLCVSRTVLAEVGSAEAPFLPTWKLLSAEGKRQFIAGYIYGWQDAHKVTGIAIDFIRENPKKAVESLESIKGLYDLSRLDPAAAAGDVDQFFADPENSKATLSSAITAVKSKYR
jgi:hypothetical protein